MKYETLKRMRNISKQGNYMFSFDLADGYYALGITSKDRDYFTVNVRGQLWRLAGLPMGWNASPYLFCTLMHQMVRWLRCPALAESSALRRPRQAARRNLRGTRWRRLPVCDVVSRGSHGSPHHRGLIAHTAGSGAQSRERDVGARSGHLEIDLARGVFRAPAEKLKSIRDLSRAILGIAGRN